MISTYLLVCVVATSTVPVSPIPPPSAQEVHAYARRCEPTSRDAFCLLLRARIETQLYGTLRQLMSTGQTVDAEVWQAALGALDPRLKELALEYVAQHGPVPGQDAAIISALESPFAGVRNAALPLVHTLSGRHTKYRERRYRDKPWNSGAIGLIDADPLPDRKRFGKLYPGASYSFLASGPKRAVLVSSDSVDAVVTFYAKGGAEVVDGKEMQRRLAAALEQEFQQQQQRARESMQRGEDPAKVLSEPTDSMSFDVVNWTEGVERAEGVGRSRYVILEHEKVGKIDVPTRVVVVFEDAILGGTTIFLPRLSLPSR